ncbi:acetylxylan esterase [Carboxylicivirga caseinilyticus]|uniref:acetylxylan esterase n=1 Tax=Carboxylicivirga caseinilyticus TaxID=3417572 RepID=UPI003D324906|nr:acetylxylan esterase [Marinilabiliaceae bacterium A049]
MKKLLLFVLIVINSVTWAQNSPAPIKMVDILLSPSNGDWNYNIGEDAIVEISVLKYGVPINNIEINYEYGPELLKADKQGKLILLNGTGSLNIETTNQPGFRQLKVWVELDGYKYKNQINLGYSPDKIKPTQLYPDDFESFWTNAVKELRTIGFKTELNYLPEFSTEKVETFLMKMSTGLGKKTIFGYLSKPREEGKYPVLFLPPGAGVKPIKPYLGFAEQGYISLSIEIHGINPMLDKEIYSQISSAFGNYVISNLDNRDEYYYKNVYLSCVRCVDYLCGLSEFDGKNVFVSGGSQGGALAIVTAALNEKVTALVSFYPALCDLTGYLYDRAGGWPHMFRDEKIRSESRIKTSAYFDVANFSRMLKVPGFYSWGYNDTTCCPTSVYSAFNLITSPKEKWITPVSGHWRFPESNEKSLNFLKRQVK